MTRRSIALPLAALASLAIIVAACGGGAASNAPGATGTTPPAATQPTVTQGPASTDGSEPSFDLSSFHSDQNLESLFPKEIGGETVTVLSMTGDQFMDGGASPELDAALGTLGKSAADLSVAFGGASVGDSSVSIIAFKLSGVPGNTILSALITAYQQENESTSSDVSFGGKSVKKFTPTDPTGDVLYVYVSQDVVFSVGGSDVTDALLNEIFTKLP